MPRPFDDAAKKRFIELMNQHGSRPATVAAGMDFTWATVKRHLRDDPDFADAYNQACQLANEAIEEVLYDKALDGDLGSIKMWLTNRQADQWQDSKVGAPNGATQVNVAILTTENWRGVLTNPELRDQALAFAGDIPALPIETTAVEHG